jgi:type I restriction enzyme S subunit
MKKLQVESAALSLPKGWKVEKLGDVLQKTETVNPTLKPNHDFLYVDVSSVNNQTYSIEDVTQLKGKNAPSRARKLIKTGDVIFATVRPTLKRIAIVPEEYDNQVCSTGYFVLRPRDFISNKYLFYLLLSDGFMEKMEKLQKGASYPAVTDNEVKSQMIAYPPLPEQERIVALLDETFAGLAQVHENAERNLVNAREVFEAAVREAFSDGEEWDETTLSEIADNLDSQRIPVTKRDRKEGKYPYYGASGIVDYVDKFIFDEDLLLVSEDGANLLARTYPIAFSISGKTWVNNHAHVLRFKNMATQKFVEYYLNSIPLDDYVSGMAQPKLNQAMLNSIPVFLPKSLEEQRAIVGCLDGLAAETSRLEGVYQSKLDAVEELRKSVLGKAFAGGL